MSGWHKDENGLWERGDVPKGMAVNLGERAEYIIAVIIVLILAAALFADTRANSVPQWKPERATWPGWHIIGLVAITLLGLALVALVSWGIHGLIVSSAKRFHDFQTQRDRDRIETERQKKKNGASHLSDLVAAAHISAEGALVRMIDGGWQVVNLSAERGGVFMDDHGIIRRVLDDDLHRAQVGAHFKVEEERARASAYPNLHTFQQRIDGHDNPQALAAPAAAAWPELVALRDIMPSPPSLHTLALGVTIDGEGRQQVVTTDLAEIPHGAIGGSSGWGKSTFFRSLAYQLATAAEDVHLVMVDIEGLTFGAFASCQRLLYPVADSEGRAVAIAQELRGEMERRNRLYQEFPGVDNLPDYNNLAGDEPLLPIVVLIDESVILLGDRGAHTAVRTLAIRARKYGIWMFLGGQDWKASTLDSTIRNQLSCRIQFKANSGAQSRTLIGDGAAFAIERAGRAYALLPGRRMVEIQAPYITPEEIRSGLDGQSGPMNPMPDGENTLPEMEQRILALRRQGKSQREIEYAIFGKTGGSYYNQVRRVLVAHDLLHISDGEVMPNPDDDMASTGDVEQA